MNPLEKRYGISGSATLTAGTKWIKGSASTPRRTAEPLRLGGGNRSIRSAFSAAKHTALGRIKHEGAAVTIAPVTALWSIWAMTRNSNTYINLLGRKIQPAGSQSQHAPAGKSTLYVAKFNDDGKGEWLPLVSDKMGSTPVKGLETRATC